MFEKWTERLNAFSGDKSVYFKNLKTGETYQYNADAALNAASVIKLPVMLELFRAYDAGELDLNERIPIREEDKLPSCGVLRYISVTEMSLRDLAELMIIVSDNTAANLLIKRLGMEQINRAMRAQGMEKSTLRRLLFDSEAAARGLNNTVTMREIGLLLEKIATFSSIAGGAADMQMLGMLLNQRLNGKIPFYLGKKYRIAHKTGEDDGITHDAAILCEKEQGQPLCVMCFGSEHVFVPDFERLMQDFSREMAERL